MLRSRAQINNQIAKMMQQGMSLDEASFHVRGQIRRSRAKQRLAEKRLDKAIDQAAKDNPQEEQEDEQKKKDSPKGGKRNKTVKRTDAGLQLGASGKKGGDK